MRIAIISDIHANLEAFETVLEDTDCQKIDQIISLGDSIGYGADPEAVMRLLISRNIPSVLGNHEWACINEKVYRWYIRDVKQSLDMTKDLLSEASYDYLNQLSVNTIFHDLFFVHGFPPDSVRHYLHQVLDAKIIAALGQLTQRFCFVGHTHRLNCIGLKNGQLQSIGLGSSTIVLDENTQYIINAGSVGQPRDGDLRTKYLIFDTIKQEITVRKLNYDYRTAAQKIVNAGMPARYAKAVNPDIGL